MNNNLEKLYDKIYSDESTKNPRKFIQVIETDLSTINVFDNDASNQKLTRLVGDYGISLAQAGYIKKSLSYLERAIKWYESDEKVNDLWAETMYETLIFNRGFVNQKLQNRKKAHKDFKKLTQKYPDNDLYQNWLKSGADFIYRWIEWIFFGITIISSFFTVLLNKEDGIFGRIAFYGIFVGIAGGLTVNLLSKKRLKIK